MSSEWVDVKFSEVAKLTTGKLDSNAAVLKGRYPFFTCAPETSAIDSYAFDMEAVLLAGNNANANFPIKYYKGKFNAYQRTYVIDSKNPNKLRTKFLFYALESSLRELKKLSVGSATKFLTKVILENLDIKLPSIAEQDVILELLGSIDDRITLLRETNATLEAIAQALFKSWFVDFDPVHANAHARAQNQNSHPQAAQPNPAPHTAEANAKNLGLDAATAALFPDNFQDSDLGPIPAGWRVVRLEEISEILNGFAFKSEDYVEKDQGIFVLRTTNFSDSGYAERLDKDVYLPSIFQESHEKYLCEPFDFHLVMVGASVGHTSLLLPHLLPAFRNQNMWCFREKTNFPSKFFVHEVVKAHVSDALRSTSGSAREFFRKGDFGARRVLKPSNDLLIVFEEKIAALKNKIAVNAEQAQTLTQLRDTLLPRLISGQLRLPEAEAQIEAVVGGA